jgi:acyl carrier protein
MTTEDRLRAFIVRDLRWPGSIAELTDDLPLLERRVIDSLAIFRLVAFIEDQFEISIDDQELVPDNFATLTSLRRFVEAKARRQKGRSHA